MPSQYPRPRPDPTRYPVPAVVTSTPVLAPIGARYPVPQQRQVLDPTGTRSQVKRLLEPTFLAQDFGLSAEMQVTLKSPAPIPPRLGGKSSILSVCSGTVLEMLKRVTVSIVCERRSLT
jgi:hypothetical protein